MINKTENVIGKKVRKKSNKPFKSKFQKNTVKCIIEHPERKGKLAYLFEEDDSYVSVEQCEFVD